MIEGETLEDIKQTRHRSTRAILRRSSSSSPEDPTGSSWPQANNFNITDNHDHQNSFRDTLVTKPVLFGGSLGAEHNLDTNDKNGDNPQSTCGGWEASDNDSTIATFAGCGGDEGEKGVGNYSIMSGTDRAMPVFCLTHLVLTRFGSDISAFHISALA